MFVSISLITFSLSTLDSLKPLDTEFMKKLDKVVNVVPVIAKADTLTIEERELFKQRVRKHRGGTWEGVTERVINEEVLDKVVNVV